MEYSDKGSIFRPVQPTASYEMLFKFPDIWMTTSSAFDKNRQKSPGTDLFFVVGIMALCIVIVTLCVLIAYLAFRLISRRKLEKAYERKRLRSAIYRPVVETVVNTKTVTKSREHSPAGLTMETEVTTSHQPLNNLNKAHRMSTPKLGRHITKLPTPVKPYRATAPKTTGVMNITESPFHNIHPGSQLDLYSKPLHVSTNSNNIQLFKDFGSQNLSPLERSVHFNYYRKVQSPGGKNPLINLAMPENDLTTETGRNHRCGPDCKDCKVLNLLESPPKLYTLTFDVEVESDSD